MGLCMKNCEGTFCLKMVDPTAIFGQIFFILMLDQYSQRIKMRLEQANLIKIIAKLYELFLEVTPLLSKINCKFGGRFILKQL